MDNGAAVLLVLGLFVVGGVLLAVGRRQDARRRAAASADAPGSTAALTVLVPVVTGVVAVAAALESLTEVRGEILALDGAAVVCAVIGSIFLTRFSRRALRRRSGQPWTSDRVASLIFFLAGGGLVIAALDLAITH